MPAVVPAVSVRVAVPPAAGAGTIELADRVAVKPVIDVAASEKVAEAQEGESLSSTETVNFAAVE